MNFIDPKLLLDYFVESIGLGLKLLWLENIPHNTFICVTQIINCIPLLT
jgi:hypothetical protein